MPDPFTPANPEDLREAIGYALRFSGTGKPHRAAGDDMARIAADIIARHLEQSGFVIMKRPPGPLHSTVPRGRIPLKP